MAPGPIVRPLPKYAKWIIQHLPGISTGLQEAVDYIGNLYTADESTPTQWRRFVYVWERIGNLDTSDRAVTTFDVLQHGSTALGSDWDASSTGTAAGILDTVVNWWTLNHVGAQHRCFETRVYRMEFAKNPNHDPQTGRDHPFVKSGTPLVVRSQNWVSNVPAQVLPGQVAITSTEKTPYPRHWGRNYWPFPSVIEVDPQGRVLQATVDDLATFLHDAIGALNTSNFQLVVPVTQTTEAGVTTPQRILAGVNAIQVDNTFDIQRRRRAHTTTYRKRYP